MSDAAEKLAQTRLAIIAHVQARERRHERRTPEEDEESTVAHAAHEVRSGARRAWDRGSARAAGWLGRARHILRTWWRHHPASMGVELATPALASYAARKPVQYLGIAAGVGALLALTRPWRLVSATGLLVAVLKSSQLSSLVMSAMSGADFGHEDEPPA